MWMRDRTRSARSDGIGTGMGGSRRQLPRNTRVVLLGLVRREIRALCRQGNGRQGNGGHLASTSNALVIQPSPVDPGRALTRNDCYWICIKVGIREPSNMKSYRSAVPPRRLAPLLRQLAFVGAVILCAPRI